MLIDSEVLINDLKKKNDYAPYFMKNEIDKIVQTINDQPAVDQNKELATIKATLIDHMIGCESEIKSSTTLEQLNQMLSKSICAAGVCMLCDLIDEKEFDIAVANFTTMFSEREKEITYL